MKKKVEEKVEDSIKDISLGSLIGLGRIPEPKDENVISDWPKSDKKLNTDKKKK